MGIVLKTFVLGSIENNNYLLIDEASKEAVLIDCTEPSQEIEDALSSYGADLKYILLTHGHFDHVLGVNYFKAKYNCKAYIHKNDEVMLEKMNEFTTRFGLGEVEVQKVDGTLNDGDELEFAGDKIKVIHTPGHTQGGVCYVINDMIFTGDTLFYESVGRTDLPGGDFNQLKSSIENKLFTLDGDLTVYPGHGWKSTIAHEKKNNRFL